MSPPSAWPLCPEADKQLQPLTTPYNPLQPLTTPYRWAFSLYLEAVAVLPQLFMLQKQGGSENLTSHYIFLLGM